MTDIRKYVLVGRDDVEQDYEYLNYQEAEENARRQDCAVIARTYTYEDSDLVWTPNGANTWPPEPKGH